MSQQSQFKMFRHRFDSGALGSALVDLNAIKSRNDGFHCFWNGRPKRHEREQFIAWISFVAGAVVDRIGIALSYHFKWINETTEIWIFERR